MVALWFFAQPSKTDVRAIRPVDPTQQLVDFTRANLRAPVPHTPVGYTSTVSAFDVTTGLRIGYVTPQRQYAEVLATAGPSEPFVAEQTLKGALLRSVDVAGAPWELRQGADGHLSLDRVFGKITVVVGGVRQSAALPELVQLASTVRPDGVIYG